MGRRLKETFQFAIVGGIVGFMLGVVVFTIGELLWLIIQWAFAQAWGPAHIIIGGITLVGITVGVTLGLSDT